MAVAKLVLGDEVEAKYYYPNTFAKGDHTEAAKTAREVLLARGVPAEELDQIVARAEQKAAKEAAAWA